MTFYHFSSGLTITDRSMLPLLIPGDVVAIDHKAYLWKTPQIGDVIAIQCDHDSVQIRRVIVDARSDDTIKTKGFMSWYNQKNIHRQDIQLEIDSLPPPIHSLMRHFNFYYESSLHHNEKYITAYPKYPTQLSLKEKQVVKTKSMLYVLPDMREMALSTLTCAGLIPVENVVGKVKYIDYNIQANLVNFPRHGIVIK